MSASESEADRRMDAAGGRPAEIPLCNWSEALLEDASIDTSAYERGNPVSQAESVN